jgi:hypothetical protein
MRKRQRKKNAKKAADIGIITEDLLKLIYKRQMRRRTFVINTDQYLPALQYYEFSQMEYGQMI